MPCRSLNVIAVLVSLLLTAFTSLSCGKVGAPVAPSRITQHTSDLKAVQRGSAVVLSWPVPVLISEASSRDYIARVEIYRLIEGKDEEPVLDADDFEKTAALIGYLDRAVIDALAKSLGSLQYSDSIDLTALQGANTVRLRYAVRYINKRDQKSLLSNSVAIEPISAVASRPTDLHVAEIRQDEIKLEWTPSESNVDGTRPASIVGYNLYRRTARREALRDPLNREPLTEPRFTDTKFQYKTEYVYVVRALSTGATGLVESIDGEPLRVTPVDSFAPSAPEPVSLASANGVVSLFWPTSPEHDVVGYNVYRAESASADDWIKLTAEGLSKATTYRDDRVVIGKRYFYKVTAVDRFENESAPSRIVSETANP